MPKIITVCGMPRSGTTALARCIARHAPSTYLPELHFPLMLREGGVPQKLPEIASDRQNLFRLYECGLPSNLERACLEYMELRNAKPFSRIAIEATPANIELLLDKSLSQNVAFVIIVRKPSDVANSILQQPWGSKHIERILYRWLRYLWLTIQYRRDIIVFDYEFFCSESFSLSDDYRSMSEDLSGDENQEFWKLDASLSPLNYKTKRKKSLTFHQRFLCWLTDVIFYTGIFKLIFKNQKKQLVRLKGVISNY